MHLLEGVRIAVHPEGWEVASAGGRTAGSRGTGGDPPPQAETISLFNVDSGDRSGALRGNSSPVVSLTYSPSGKGFASLARDGGLLYFPTRKGQGVTASTEATAFAFLGDATLVVGTRSGSAFMFDANQPPPGQRLVGLDQPVLNIATEGGRAIAIQTASGRTFVCRREGACTEARFHGATRGGLSFAPGGLALGSVPADGVPVWIETGG